MSKKVLIITLAIIIALVTGIYIFIINSKEFQTVVSPFNADVHEDDKEDNKLKSLFAKKSEIFGDTINILLVGIDTSEGRRSRGQTGFNTDTMILLSVNTKTNKVLFTSVPRDLWINGNKINALYTVYGEETLVDAFEKVTGQPVDGIIRVDFDQFEWIVDSFGGVPVNIQTTFTDVSFPNMTDSGATTVSFTQGEEIMDGWRALTFARSRKGNNGEGSDLMRAKRQHLILQGLVDAVSQNSSKFWPMNLDKFYEALTNEGVYTTLELEDCYYLWDFYKDRDLYEVESFVVDGEYVYHPGMYPESEYKAWVFIAREPGFANLHKDIQDKLDKTFIDETLVGDTGPAE